MHNPTTWEPIILTLRQVISRCRELGAAPDPTWKIMIDGDMGVSLHLAEAKARPDCDEVLRELVRTGNVTGTTGRSVTYFCLLRAMCALDTIELFRAKHNGRSLYTQPPEWPANELMEWLLVSNWVERHDFWLKMCAYTVATGNSYGSE